MSAHVSGPAREGDDALEALGRLLVEYEADPVDNGDRPSSWGKLAALLDGVRTALSERQREGWKYGEVVSWTCANCGVVLPYMPEGPCIGCGFIPPLPTPPDRAVSKGPSAP